MLQEYFKGYPDAVVGNVRISTGGKGYHGTVLYSTDDLQNLGLDLGDFNGRSSAIAMIDLLNLFNEELKGNVRSQCLEFLNHPLFLFISHYIKFNPELIPYFEMILEQSSNSFPIAFLLRELEISEEELQVYVSQIWGEHKFVFSLYDLFVLRQHSEIYFTFEKGLGSVPNLNALMKKVEHYVPNNPTQFWIGIATMEVIGSHIIKRSSEIGKVHSWCKENLTKKIPNSKLVEVKARNGKRPDFVIQVGGIEYPVECKLQFDSRHLEQIQMYMDLWEVDTGYVVAPRLNTKLPDNIIYIQSP